MAKWIALSGPAAVLIGMSGPALADVTAMEVWQNWQDFAAETGQTWTTGSVVQAGGTVTVNDLDLAMQSPEMSMQGTIAEIVFAERGDGTVEITMSPSYTLNLDNTPDDEMPSRSVLQIDQPGLTMIASGGDGAFAYDFVAPNLAVSLVEFEGDGDVQPTNMSIGAQGAAGRYTVTEGPIGRVAARLNAETVDFLLSAVDPDTGGDVAITAAFNGVEMRSDGAVGLLSDPEAISARLREGHDGEVSAAHDGAEIAIAATGAPDAFSMDAAAASGTLDVALDADGMRYATASQDVAVALSGDEIPFPQLSFQAAETGLDLLVPVLASEEPEDFGLGLTLAGLEIDEMLWGMFDPAQMIPRDPATLIVDLAGTGNWSFDIFDEEPQVGMSDAAPGELHSLDIAALELTAAGAALTGDGAFTFDNSDLTTFDGLPAPTGALNLRLVGANALLDTLVAMGLMPEDQAMGARMTLGLFARPGTGPDELLSTIEVNGDGSVFANGQRLQ